MATHRRRRPRGPERPGRRRPVRRRAARAVERGASLRQRAGAARRHAALGRPRVSTARCSTVCAAAGARGGPVDSVAVDSWGVDFGLARRGRRAPSEPRALSRRASRRARCERVLDACAGARALRAHRDSAHPDQHDLRARRDGSRGRSRARRSRRRCCSIPDLMHYWLCGSAYVGAHERDDDTVLRPAHAVAGRAICSSGSTSRPASCPRSLRPGRSSARSTTTSPRRRAYGDAAVVAVATHDTGSAVAAVPFRGPSSAFISAGTWSLVGIELRRAAHHRRDVRSEPDQRGRRRGDLPAAAERDGPLARSHECRRSWALEGHEYSFDELVALAQQAPPLRSLHRAERPGIRRARATCRRASRAFCAHTGQPVARATRARSSAASSRASR